MKKILSTIMLLVIIIALIGASGFLVYNAFVSTNKEVKNPVLSLDIENYGTVKIELYPEYAPNTVSNIIALSQNGYYNGKVFYGMDSVAVYVGRNQEGETVNPKMFDIDKSIDENDTNKNYEYSIDGEFVANQFKQNTLKHKKGVVSLVRADYTQQIESLTEESYNSGNSQFTIVMNEESASNLNGIYAAFGKVVEGLDIVEKIYGLETKTEENDGENSNSDVIKSFQNAPVITKAEVETFGENYGLPKTHKAFDYSEYLQKLMTQYYSSNNAK